MRLRPATIEDFHFLLRLRNDPDTRANSNNHNIVTKAQHYQWMADTLLNQQRKLYIAEVDGVDVGTCRADYVANECELSWTVAPEHRKKGYGHKMVWLLKDATKIKYKVEVLPHNTASRKIAERLKLV